MAGLNEWAKRLLEGRHYAMLATLDADGGPHLTPVWYLFREGQMFVDLDAQFFSGLLSATPQKWFRPVD